MFITRPDLDASNKKPRNLHDWLIWLLRIELFNETSRDVLQFTKHHFHRYRHTTWALADQAIVSGCNFLTGILLARMLGISEFGRFTLAWMVVLFVQGIQHAAINAPLMSIGPTQKPEEQPLYYGSVFLQQVVFAVFSTVLAYTFLSSTAFSFPDWGLATLVVPLTAVVFLSQMQEFLRRFHFSTGSPFLSFLNDIVRYVGQLLALFFILVFFEDALAIHTAIWIVVGTSLLAVAIAATKLPVLAFSKPSWRKVLTRHWNFSKWLVSSAFIQWLTGNLYIVAAGALLGAPAVGALKAAQNLMGIAHILFLGLENIVPMSATRSYVAGGTKALCKYLYNVTLLGTAATSIIVLVFTIAPVFWFGLLFGEQFVEYSYLVYWYAALYVTMFLGIPARFGLRTYERTKAIFVALVIAAIIATTTSYPLISTFGATGAVAGMIAIQFVMQVILWATFINIT